MAALTPVWNSHRMEAQNPDRAAGRDDAPPSLETVPAAECWRLLEGVEVGRLGVAVGGEVDIYPVNFAVDAGTIVFRTAEGTKLVEVVLAHKVAFEADGYDPGTGVAWSVVVKGEGELLDRFEDIYHAQELALVPWNTTPKERFVRIVPTTVSGRRFVVERTRGDAPRL